MTDPTVINVQPIFIQDCTLVFDGDDYAAAVTSIALTPSSKNVTFQGGKRDAVFTFPAPTTWTADLTFGQDWVNAESLSFYLFNNAGAIKAATIIPANGSASWAVNLVLAEGAVGGDVGTTGTAKVSLGVSGRPVPTPPTVPGD